jgi:hypothetical protein
VTQAVPASIEAVVAILVISFVTPYLTKLLTKPGAPAFLTSGVSLLIQGLAAVGLYLGDLKGVPDWPHALGVFVAALGVTAGTRNVDLGLEGAISAKTAGFGLNAKRPSAADIDLSKAPK